MAISKVLIANRGEIALRILRACREMGLGTVAVHSEADADAMHVRLADESVCIGPADSMRSYLNIPAILSACEISGADAIHPGYGFLSESPKFSETVSQSNITFIGPRVEHVRAMGEKINAKRLAIELGLPVVPGSDGEVRNIDHARRIASDFGYPVLIKAAAGGGGRGMKIARNVDELIESFPVARAEARAAFANDAVYIEKYLAKPRHIEIQVLGDEHGNVVSLGERDCSLQRRYQKVWEETPAICLTEKQRKDIAAKCVTAMQKLRYRGAGTIEFLYENGEFYFIEMNTRIQVEHPITEMVTSVDLIRAQIDVADGKKLPWKQEDIVSSGHSIEVRINSENPFTSMPSAGKIGEFHPPGGLGVRVDSAIYNNYVIPPWYDSLIGKLIVHAESRPAALQRLRRALNETVIDGVDTTIPLYSELLDQEAIRTGDFDIHWLSNYLQHRES